MKNLLTLSLFFVCLNSNAQDTVSIYFDFNSSAISIEQLTKLKDLSKSTHQSIVSMSAYCDTVGTSNYNQKLAQRRFNSVLRKLSEKATPKAITLNGESEAAKMKVYDAAQSRRVDIVYSTITTVAEYEGKVILKQKFADFLASDDESTKMDLKLLFIPGYPVLIKICIPEIKELFELLNDNPNIDAHIHGHVCCADDYKLSYDRATMVNDYLTMKGISQDRLKFTGHSNKVPNASPEVTEEDRLSNRRVTLVFTKK